MLQQSSIDIRDFDSGKNNPSMKVNPITGDFIVTGNNTNNKRAITVSFDTIDYQTQFQQKRQALADMVGDGDGFTREEIHDLVKTANLAAWQESKDD